jgi:hypothetical protein
VAVLGVIHSHHAVVLRLVRHVDVLLLGVVLQAVLLLHHLRLLHCLHLLLDEGLLHLLLELAAEEVAVVVVGAVVVVVRALHGFSRVFFPTVLYGPWEV